MTRQEFIQKGKEIYGDKFDYRSVPDIDLQPYTMVPIYCEKHGIFYQTVYFHLQGIGCVGCLYETRKVLKN